MRSDPVAIWLQDPPPRPVALRAVLAWLDAHGYDFVTPTPSVARRAHEKRLSQGAPLRALLGWSQAVAADAIDPHLLLLLEQANLLMRDNGQRRSRLRVSRLAGMLFLHSAFPATASDAVFLGPDSYRFARLIQASTRGDSVGSIAEIGCGAGVGGLVAARLHPEARLELGDVNAAALELAAVNAAHAGVIAQTRRSHGMADLPGPYDLIVANPPYIAGASGRTYKDGGDLHGARVALDWAAQALERLTPGGKFVLYTGSAILDGGADALRLALEGLLAGRAYRLTYEELDPDIFAGELRRGAYSDVERIAAVGAVVQRLA
ncbi:methyltransferase [Caulobacter sp. 1776]|uniref:methyltransferase n=1 Tax=Caulobacter sp. 1776 TaxID=3156420 RepID=UPI003398626E